MIDAKPRTRTTDANPGYWGESARPLASLLFVVPILVAYELGVLSLGPQAVRNAADVWGRQLLDWLGFGQYFLLPLLTCGILLAWQHLAHHPWRFHWSVLFGMLLESTVFGLLLVMLAGWQQSLFPQAIACATSGEGDAAGTGVGVLALAVSYLGAGIYEELLFRLMLLPILWWLLRLAGFSERTSVATAVLLASLLFSAAHYRLDFMFAGHHFAMAHGDVFNWFSFSFRFSAGVFFSLLFLFRGFGITVGTHALYDLFTLWL